MGQIEVFSYQVIKEDSVLSKGVFSSAFQGVTVHKWKCQPATIDVILYE